MIITVTLNPAIDRTAEIGTLERGGLNRIRQIVQDAGGKGINVSKTIKALGGTSEAAGFLGGTNGDVLEALLKEYGIPSDFIRVKGETRTNLKVAEKDGTVTEFNEPGPEVTREQAELLIDRLESRASAGTLFVLAGSAPRGVGMDIYRRITERVHARGAAVLLDADGELFAHALKAAPDIVKPNRMELQKYFGLSSDVPVETLAGLGERILDLGVGLAAVSMGSEGALFLGRDQKYRCGGLPVKVRSTVGAGDAMAAALALGWERKMSLKDAAALGMAVSAGAVMTQGTKPPDAETVARLLEQVCMREDSQPVGL